MQSSSNTVPVIPVIVHGCDAEVGCRMYNECRVDVQWMQHSIPCQ